MGAKLAYAALDQVPEPKSDAKEIVGLAQIDTWMRIVLILSGIVVVIIGIAIAYILNRDAGAFECPE